MLPSLLYSTVIGSDPASFFNPNVRAMDEYPVVLIPEMIRFLSGLPAVAVKKIFPDPDDPGYPDDGLLVLTSGGALLVLVKVIGAVLFCQPV